jgi:hypothetical protein
MLWVLWCQAVGRGGCSCKGDLGVEDGEVGAVKAGIEGSLKRILRRFNSTEPLPPYTLKPLRRPMTRGEPLSPFSFFLFVSLSFHTHTYQPPTVPTVPTPTSPSPCHVPYVL